MGFGDDNYDDGVEWFVMKSALCKTDMKAIDLQMALDLLHKEESRDLITGLKVGTQTGRPDSMGEGNTNNHSEYLV